MVNQWQNLNVPILYDSREVPSITVFSNPQKKNILFGYDKNTDEHKDVWMNFKAVDNKNSSCTVSQRSLYKPTIDYSSLLYIYYPDSVVIYALKLDPKISN